MNAKRKAYLSLALALTLAGCANSDTEILEDEPGWNCETMGNKKCGPTVPDYVWESCEGTSDTDHVCNWVQEVGGPVSESYA